MKNIIITLLRTGATVTKKYNKQDLCKYLFFLGDIITERDGKIQANSNKFWTADNAQNRKDLIVDLIRVKHAKASDGAYFAILNRHANGDKYGIIKEAQT